jgi:hypothetical protein
VPFSGGVGSVVLPAAPTIFQYDAKILEIALLQSWSKINPQLVGTE